MICLLVELCAIIHKIKHHIQNKALHLHILALNTDRIGERWHEPWDSVILDTDDELNFIKEAMGFFYANHHGKYILDGSTDAEINTGPFNYSQYIIDDDMNCTLLGTFSYIFDII